MIDGSIDGGTDGIVEGVMEGNVGFMVMVGADVGALQVDKPEAAHIGYTQAGVE